MSAADGLQPKQFGYIGPAHFAPTEGETPLESYGIHPIHAGDEKDLRKYHSFESKNEVRDVPISRIRGGQHYVDTERVHDIARRGLNDPREAESGPVTGRELPTGEIKLRDGHHRTAARALNGEQFARVHIDGKYGKRWDA